MYHYNYYQNLQEYLKVFKSFKTLYFIINLFFNFFPFSLHILFEFVKQSKIILEASFLTKTIIKYIII